MFLLGTLVPVPKVLTHRYPPSPFTSFDSDKDKISLGPGEETCHPRANIPEGPGLNIPSRFELQSSENQGLPSDKILYWLAAAWHLPWFECWLLTGLRFSSTLFLPSSTWVRTLAYTASGSL